MCKESKGHILYVYKVSYAELKRRKHCSQKSLSNLSIKKAVCHLLPMHVHAQEDIIHFILIGHYKTWNIEYRVETKKFTEVPYWPQASFFHVSALIFWLPLPLSLLVSLESTLTACGRLYHPTPITTPAGFGLRLYNLWSFLKFHSSWCVLHVYDTLCVPPVSMYVS